MKERSPRITLKVTSKFGIQDLRQAQESLTDRTYPRPRQPGGAALTARSGLGSAAPGRVLLISWEYPPVIEGGLGRHVRKLSEHIVREGVEMHVLTRRGGSLPAAEVRR